MIAESFVLHLVGDYVTQSRWMAVEKTKRWWPAIVHGVVYGLPFLLLTRSVPALLVIAGTHIVLDHYRLAVRLVWVKNLLAPKSSRTAWAEAKANFGFAPSVPAGLAMTLMVIVDNTVHIAINIAALAWL